MRGLLPYFVLRSAAIELDRQGQRPGVLVTTLAGIASAATLGMAAIVAFVVAWTALAALGIVH